MCKVFPSSLGPMAMKWFDRLRERSIDSYEELTRAFGARFITCNRVSRTLDSLLALLMREGETLKTYSDRYWELTSWMGTLKTWWYAPSRAGYPPSSTYGSPSP